MDIKSLTQKMHEFVLAKGWYEPDSPRPQNLRNLVISLNLEASELLELVQWGEDISHIDSLASELADVSLYLLQIASISGIDLEKAITDKLLINYGRHWDESQGQELGR